MTTTRSTGRPSSGLGGCAVRSMAAALNPGAAFRSWARVERVRALFVELVLQLDAFVVRFCGADGFNNSAGIALHVPLAELFRGNRAVARIVIGKPGVPPDAGIDVVRKAEAFWSAPDSREARSR